MENLAKAIVAVMSSIKGIEKGATVGSGNYSYKGITDKDVKKIVGKAMQDNGLCLVPISIEPTTNVERWEEKSQYGVKMKSQVFTEVKTKYLLLHESGESMEVAGYGHGVDTSDKAAGKATTYAMKYAMLYCFLVPVGEIDDADKTHSKDNNKKNGSTLSDSLILDLNKVKDLTELNALYQKNKKLVSGNMAITKLFTAKKESLGTAI